MASNNKFLLFHFRLRITMMPLLLSGTILASLLIVNSQDVTPKSPTSTILRQVATTQTDDMFLMFQQLTRQYTPNCLKVIMYTSDMKGRNNHLPQPDIYSQARINVHNVQGKTTMASIKPEAQIFIRLDGSNDTETTLQYINANPERVTPYSCVAFILTQPPGPHLLPLLTDTSSYKRLTRYFLVNCESWVTAERFLLDQLLLEQVNVVALLQLERGSRIVWDVLIRKLIHISGSPKVFRINQWSARLGFNSNEELFPEQMGNFYGKKLIGATLRFKPLVDFDTIEGSRVVRPKPSLDTFMLKVIAQKMNFTYDLVMPEDGQWGNLKEKVCSV